MEYPDTEGLRNDTNTIEEHCTVNVDELKQLLGYADYARSLLVGVINKPATYQDPVKPELVTPTRNLELALHALDIKVDATKVYDRQSYVGDEMTILDIAEWIVERRSLGFAVSIELFADESDEEE